MQRKFFIGFIIAWSFFSQLALSNSRHPGKLPERSAGNLSVTFLKDTVSQTGNAFSFNTITIINTGPVLQEFTISTEIPEGWQQVIDTRKLYQIKPNEQLTIPMRIAATPVSTSTVYPITINIQTSGINEKSSFIFYSKVNQNSNWKAELLNPNLKLLRDTKETLFQISLSNRGNQPEYLTLNFNTSLELTVPNRNNRITLLPNKDTIFTVGIITELRFLEEFKPQEINISISNRSGDFKLFSQNVYSWGTIFKENPSQWYNIPLAIEMISQNVTSDRKSMYMTGSGHIDFAKRRSISFNYRSDNFYSVASRGSTYANVNYNSPNLKISLGDQTEFNNFLLDGTGVRINYGTAKKYSFNAIGVKGRQGDTHQMSLSQRIDIGVSHTINNLSFVNLDYETGTNSYFSILGYEHYFKNTHFSLEGGLSREENKRTATKRSVDGNTAAFKFDHNSRHLMIRSYGSINSKVFPGTNRGLTLSGNELRFKQKSTFEGLVFDYTDRTVTRIDSIKVNSVFSGRTNEYGIRLGFNQKGHYINLKATMVSQLQDSLNNITFLSEKLNLNTAWKLFGNLNINLDGNIARSYPKSPSPISPFISKNVFGTVQFKGLGTFIRYEDGPFYYYDLRAYAKDQLKIHRVQLTPFLESSLFNSIINLRLQVDYSSDLVSKISTTVARGDINFNLEKQALSFRIFGSYDLKPSQFSKQNILSVSMRKNFGLPLVGIQKYRNLKVVLYKDKNFNEVFDTGDESIPESNLQIGNQTLITNQRGEVYYRNISTGKYVIDLSEINNIRGWVAKNGFKQPIDVSSNQTVYIPFKESKYLSGSLNIVRDERSNRSFNPSNIRITAINSKGEVFYTLTNQKGEFFLNLSADTYIIQINTNVFSENFRVLQESFNADLLNKSEENIVFEIRESRRQINIQRQPDPVKP